MAGDCSFFSSIRVALDRGYSGGSAFRLALIILLALVCVGAPLSASAQLPGTNKPEEFKPVIPDFSEPSADWWTSWPEVSHEEREQWLKELRSGWQEWRATLPETEPLQKLAQAVTDSFEDVETNWAKAREYRKIPVLPGIAFPSEPNVLDWAEADAILARARKRRVSLELETRKLDESLAQSLAKLRNQVGVLRDVRGDPLATQVAGLTLLIAQIEYLNIIERRASLIEQLETWREEIKLGSEQLALMQENLQFSAEAGEKLNGEIEKLEQQITKQTGERTNLQGTTLKSTDPSLTLEKELKVMELQVLEVEGRLKMRKREILRSINLALDPQGEDLALVQSRDLLDTARSLVDETLRELNVRQRQVASWLSEDPDAMSRWWAYFEKVSSGITRIDDLVKDVQRYETAQLSVFKERKGWWATVRERAMHFLGVAQSRWGKLADYQLFTISQTPITPRVVAKIIFILICAWLISGLIRRFLNRLVRKQHASESSMYNLGRVLHYSIIALGLLFALSLLGLDTSKLALVAGALSVGIGFGLQAIFSNFISGLILLFEQPLRVGDLVELESGVFGRIRDINVRSTRITTRDNIDILVPNSEFVAGRVINHTLDDPVRRIHVPFGVAYGSDPDLVRDAAMAAAERVNITHSDWQRKTEVWLMEFGDSALNFKLVVWVNSNMVSPLGDPYAMYNLELLREFNERGIEVPFPQRDLHLRSWDPALPITRRGQK